MGLIDRINSVPLNAAAKIAERTGRSKYSLAQICNFTAGASSLYATIAAYNNGDGFAAFVGGLFTFMQGVYTFSNPKRKEQEQPGFVDKTVEDLSDKIDMGKPEIKEKLEYSLALTDKFEKASTKAGFFQTANSVFMAALAGMAYSQASLDAQYKDYGLYLGLFSVTLFFSGISHYFRACEPKKK